MRELIESMFRLSWATSLFGARQFAGLARGDSACVSNAFERVAAAAAGSAGPPSSSTPARPTPPPPPSSNPIPRASGRRPVDAGRLDVSRFVVLGEGLAAGMGSFTLADDTQRFSFPAQMAQQMGAAFPQPLIEPPGIGDAIGFQQLPVIVPNPVQSTVLDRIPPERPANLSAPGFTLSDAVHLRPRQPLIDRRDSKQTAANLILGMRDFAYGVSGPLSTQLEAAVHSRPTLALVCLGFTEALDAAINGDLDRLPTWQAFHNDYREVVHALRAGGAEVVVLTVPDPALTAHFADIAAAARTAKIDPADLMALWGVEADDLISVNGINEISFQILNWSIQRLPREFLLPLSKAAELRARIHDINREIVDIAQAEGARVFNLACYFKNVRENGVAAGQRSLTADYLGGFYTLNGYYPGATGHALIANEILVFLNREYTAAFPSIDIAGVMAADSVAACRPAAGPNWTRTQLDQRRAPNHAKPAPAPPAIPPEPAGPKRLPLRLPEGLEQVLPLNPALSYFGDGIAALNCTTPQTIQFGSGGNLIFGGLAMVDSHLTGNLRVRFSPPVNNCTQFQISFEGGLAGDDQVLAAPRFFKMPFRQNRVTDIPGFVSSGTLNLATGDVDTQKGALNLFARYNSSALNALIALNPTFPLPPAAPLSFPGQYGSACMVFEQRPDGKLDVTFSGTTFVPLGNNIVWPLNFVGPSNQYATIPANGTVLHPHLALSTKQSAAADATANPTHDAGVPSNVVREYTLFAPISSFGDVFSLQAPQLGGPATGRSRLLGRVQIQFGPRCGSIVPVAVSTTTAGGLIAPTDPSPLTQLFPGRLTPGPEGFYENLSFPLRSYSLNDLAIVDDPFDISIGAVDVRTGRLLHPLLHRGFINQDLIFALIRVEPCTPQNSFMFRGPAEFRAGTSVFQYYGQVHIPYPPGFLFPDPNLATGFPIGPGSALDPYLWIWAMEDNHNANFEREGGGDREYVSTRGERFTYRYSISVRPDGHSSGAFEYENRSQRGKFRMHSIAWAGLGKTVADPAGEFEVLSFTGFGVWSKDGLEQVEAAAVQICVSDRIRYVGIQIGRADVSNVNTPIPPDLFPVQKPELGGYVCCIGLPNQPPPSPPPPRPCPPPPPCGAAV